MPSRSGWHLSSLMARQVGAISLFSALGVLEPFRIRSFHITLHSLRRPQCSECSEAVPREVDRGLPSSMYCPPFPDFQNIQNQDHECLLLPSRNFEIFHCVYILNTRPLAHRKSLGLCSIKNRGVNVVQGTSEDHQVDSLFFPRCCSTIAL